MSTTEQELAAARIRIAYLEKLSQGQADKANQRADIIAAKDAEIARAGAQALYDAAEDIQALHPGETKNSVIWLRDRARKIEKGKI